MQRARRRDGHLRRHLAVRLEIFEMLDVRMAGEADLADNAHAFGLGGDTRELDALGDGVKLDTIEPFVEVELPPGTAELAVGRELQPDLFLLADDLVDLTILD